MCVVFFRSYSVTHIVCLSCVCVGSFDFSLVRHGQRGSKSKPSSSVLMGSSASFQKQSQTQSQSQSQSGTHAQTQTLPKMDSAAHIRQLAQLNSTNPAHTHTQSKEQNTTSSSSSTTTATQQSKTSTGLPAHPGFGHSAKAKVKQKPKESSRDRDRGRDTSQSHSEGMRTVKRPHTSASVVSPNPNTHAHSRITTPSPTVLSSSGSSTQSERDKTDKVVGLACDKDRDRDREDRERERQKAKTKPRHREETKDPLLSDSTEEHNTSQNKTSTSTHASTNPSHKRPPSATLGLTSAMQVQLSPIAVSGLSYLPVDDQSSLPFARSSSDLANAAQQSTLSSLSSRTQSRAVMGRGQETDDGTHSRQPSQNSTAASVSVSASLSVASSGLPRSTSMPAGSVIVGISQPTSADAQSPTSTGTPTPPHTQTLASVSHTRVQSHIETVPEESVSVGSVSATSHIGSPAQVGSLLRPKPTDISAQLHGMYLVE